MSQEPLREDLGKLIGYGVAYNKSNYKYDNRNIKLVLNLCINDQVYYKLFTFFIVISKCILGELTLKF